MSRFLIFSLFTFSILSLILGFSFNEDLSSGGSRYDFYLTLNVIKNLANLNLVDYSEYTRHFPLHYFLLAVLYNLFNDDLFLRIIYYLALVTKTIERLVMNSLKKLMMLL